MELIPFTCPTCKKIIAQALPGASVLCPFCHKWIKDHSVNIDKKFEMVSNTNVTDQKSKPRFQCQKCGQVFEANSNRQKSCPKCQKYVRREQKRNWDQNFRKSS